MQELLKIDEYEKNFKWQFKDNECAGAYRSSFIPFYLLEHEATNFPRYVDFSDLSKNLCIEFTTNIKLYLSPEIKKDINELILANNKAKLLRSPELRKDAAQSEEIKDW